MPRYCMKVTETVTSYLEVEAETAEEARRKFVDGDEDIETEVRYPADGERVDWDVLDIWEDLDD